MYEALYQYLIHHKNLPVPGIGTFLLERKPAVSDFPSRMIYPPGYSVALQAETPPPSKIFFSWLGAALQVSDRDAIRQFNDFIFGLKQQVSDGDAVHWKGVGVLSRGLAGDLRFLPDHITLESPVKAEKVIREKAEHMVRVGEDQKTSAEMETLLNLPGEKRSYGWVYAAVLGVLAVLFIGWYFSENGVKPAASANSSKITPREAPASYRVP
jgi:hypothetical protein